MDPLYILLKMWIFHCYVSLPVYIYIYIHIISRDDDLVSQAEIVDNLYLPVVNEGQEEDK